MNPNQLNELDKLTDSIARGERVVLFAPGLWAIIVTIFLLLGSTVILSGVLISYCCADLEAPTKTLYQFIGLLSLFIFVILPTLFLFRGYKLAIHIKLAYSVALASVSIAGIVLLDLDDRLLPLTLSFISAVTGFFLVRSPYYFLCSEFYYLLRMKRKTAQ